MSTYRCPATLDQFPPANDWLVALLPQSQLTPKHQSHLLLIFEELFVNIVNYAYPEAPGDIAITYTSDNGATLTFCDWGIPFNPFENVRHIPILPEEDPAPGGLGIPFVCALADRFTYTRDGDTNLVTIHKAP